MLYQIKLKKPIVFISEGLFDKEETVVSTFLLRSDGFQKRVIKRRALEIIKKWGMTLKLESIQIVPFSDLDEIEQVNIKYIYE